MGKSGKISSIKKEYNRNSGSLEASLSFHGYSRFPGTGVRFEVYKEPNGKYRTGLDETALYITKLPEDLKKIEIERVKETRKRLEELTGLDLGPTAPYYKDRYKDGMQFKAEITRLKEGDNVFNFDNPYQWITYEWLRVHPLIATSYAAYEKGIYPSNTQFFVNDDNIEEEIKYKKKVLINTAIRTLDDMSLERRKKVARLLGLPVTDSSKENIVYNVLDTFIKQVDIKSGDYKGANPIDLFNKFSLMDDKLVNVKDLVDQALRHTIYRTTKGGRITEGGQEIAHSKDDLVTFLILDKNQDDLLALEEKLKAKKSTLA